MISSPLRNTDALHDDFLAGLERQLEDKSLGAFVLVLANACFDAGLFTRLEDRLHGRFAECERRLRGDLARGRPVDATQDDQLVFLKLMAIGFDRLSTTESERRNGWELQYNLLRGLRPPRYADQPAQSIRAPFDPHCFNFTRAHLAGERLWAGALGDHDTALFFNKFPFIDSHLILVPDADERHPQYLTRVWLEYAWRLTEGLADRLPGIGVGYNSIGASASVNHLHFQLFCRDRPLPVEADHWLHRGGEYAYPAECLTAHSEDVAFAQVEELNARNIPYNLLIRPGRSYLLPRRSQGSYATVDWLQGHAWYEMCGGVVLTDRDRFESLASGQIAAELARVTLSPATEPVSHRPRNTVVG